MAEQTFLSPGFFENEIDLTQRSQTVSGVPGGIVGSSERGPAFVPVTVGSFTDFSNRFGGLSEDYPASHAANEFLRNKTAMTFVRVLGAGANASTSDIAATQTQGIVRNAGFKLSGSVATVLPADTRHNGAVQFLVAKHTVTANEAVGFPVFSDNVSFNVGTSPGSDTAQILRAVIMTPSGTRIQLLDHDDMYISAGGSSNAADDVAAVGGTALTNGMAKKFKLVVSSSSPGYATTERRSCIRIYTASLDPRSSDYIANILNTDPNSFQSEEHLLYAHFPVEAEIAEVTTTGNAVAIVSGSNSTSSASGNTTLPFRDSFGKFDARYQTARTPAFISQPFRDVEHDLFHFEAIDDGSAGNAVVKVSIANLKKSEDPNNPYGTFDVLVRRFTDTDSNIQILEQFSQCDLNPQSDRYLGLIVGDRKVYFNFDAENEAERRFVTTGQYPNRSSYVRVVLSQGVRSRTVPSSALPFGFRGIPLLKTNGALTDSSTLLAGLGVAGDRLALVKSDPATDPSHEKSILPPVPFRFKVTRGSVDASGNFTGFPGINEYVDGRLYWGVKFESAPSTAVVPDGALSANDSSDVNPLIANYAKFIGIQKLDNLVTGSGADSFNNNKFTLARVALLNAPVGTRIDTALTGSAAEHMLGAAYIRNGVFTNGNYTLPDPQVPTYDRITLASVLALTSSVYFNRFSGYAKFTAFMYGGFDGVNILDKDMSLLNDRSTSADGGGKALSSIDIGIPNPAGVGLQNNGVASYNAAVGIITNPMSSRINLLAVPGIRDPLVTDTALSSVRTFSKAAYVIDIPPFTEDSVRVFSKDGRRPDVQTTADRFTSRAIDNNYGAAYFPDVTITDPTGRKINVPASVAALGGISYSDRVAYPWYAPAGFTRGALGFVTNTQVRLNSADRDTLYVARINPIARLPDVGYVIFGQKTLQIARSALDRLNVRRLLLEVKRIVSDIALTIVFEQNTAATRSRFVNAVTPQLAIIQAQQGIESFSVVMDERNNTEADVEANRLNGRIVIVPTRAVEFVVVDFIITNAGVSFE